MREWFFYPYFDRSEGRVGGEYRQKAAPVGDIDECWKKAVLSYTRESLVFPLFDLGKGIEDVRDSMQWRDLWGKRGLLSYVGRGKRSHGWSAWWRTVGSDIDEYVTVADSILTRTHPHITELGWLGDARDDMKRRISQDLWAWGVIENDGRPSKSFKEREEAFLSARFCEGSNV